MWDGKPLFLCFGIVPLSPSTKSGCKRPSYRPGMPFPAASPDGASWRKHFRDKIEPAILQWGNEQGAKMRDGSGGWMMMDVFSPSRDWARANTILSLTPVIENSRVKPRLGAWRRGLARGLRNGKAFYNGFDKQPEGH